MYRTLTYPEFFCRLPYCCFRFYYVVRNFHCTFFDVIFQKKSSEGTVFTVYAEDFCGMSSVLFSQGLQINLLLRCDPVALDCFLDSLTVHPL